MLTIELPDEIEQHFEPLAKAAGKAAEDYVYEIVAEYLMDLQDLHIAEQRMADLRSGKTKTISSAELRKELGLDD